MLRSHPSSAFDRARNEPILSGLDHSERESGIAVDRQIPVPRQTARPAWRPPGQALPTNSPKKAESPSKAVKKKTLPTPRKKRRSAMVYAAAGFVCGVFTWHTVGFWVFMQDIVFTPETTAQIASDKATHRLMAGQHGISANENCVAIARGGLGLGLRRSPCVKSSKHFRDAGWHGRSDKFASTSARMGNSEPPSTAAPSGSPVAWTD